jgi:hypothetical protein
MIDGFLINLIYLEPLNLFLYTWRFLSELEQSFIKPAAKTFLKWFAHISILFIPSVLISVVIAAIVESARYDYYLFHLKKEKDHYASISNALFKAVGILGPLTNLISCLILAFVIVLVAKMSRQVQMGASIVADKTKINTLVTGSHIGVTLAFTITQVMIIFYKNPTKNFRIQSAFTFFGGLAEMFLSVMLWFILDSQK